MPLYAGAIIAPLGAFDCSVGGFMEAIRIVTAAVFALGTTAFAQTPTPSTGTQTPSPSTGSQTSSQTSRPASDTGQAGPITVTGCVQREADYRQAQNIGRGGTAGTGAGQGNEYVLTNATMGGASGTSATGTSGSSTGSSATGGSTTGGATAGGSTTGGSTSSAAGAGGTSSGAGASTTGGASMAYELSGPQEGQLASHVGQRVEIMGTLKSQEMGANGPTGGPTANIPGMRSDLRLREIEVTSVRAATGGAACPRSSN
jgi:hypothetical protein